MRTMDDQFLYQLREQPDLAFASNLHNKLTQVQPAPKWRLNINFHALRHRKARLVWIAALMVISFLTVMTISPVRAFVSAVVIRIAGQAFELTEDYPDAGDAPTINPQVMPLVEAMETFPLRIKLPTVPDEFTLDEDNVDVYTGEDAGRPLPDMMIIRWKPSKGSLLILRVIGNFGTKHGELVAPGSVEEVILNDEHSAALIRGGWYQNEETWSYEMGNLRLRWLVDGSAYELLGNTENITVEQLIEMAVSTLE